MRNILGGAAVAALMAAAAIVPSVFGISTWKIVLGAVGFALIVLAGRDRSSS
jgi:hypothetical protein